MAGMQIEIWSDVICPWCWIGKARLQAALAEFEHADEVEILHRAYMLGPNQPISPTAEILKRNYNLSEDKLAQMQARVVQAAAEVGLSYHPEGSLSGDTRDAHRLIAFAGPRGQEMLDRLYTAYFTEGRSVHHRESLADLAQELGFERAAVLEMFASEAFMEGLVRDLSEAQQMQVQGVPFFVLGRRLAVPGAQEPATLLGALREAWALHAPKLTDQPYADGAVCGPDGC